MAVSAVVDDWHAAPSKADEARYFGHFAAEAVFLGTDGTERWDKAAFPAYAHPHFAKGKGWTLKPSDRKVSFSADGKTAWFDEKVLSPNYGPSRGSGVLVLEGGAWKLAQYNLSVPIPNALLMRVAGLVRDGAPPAGDIAVPAAAKLVSARAGDEDFVILDVRTPAEAAAGRIKGSVNLDFDAPGFRDRAAALDKSKTYLVHCAKGGRSKKAETVFKELGFGTVYNMLGGMTDWKKQGLPVEE
ncbi:MAG: nuclear transport factor 2 family protein [Elusimicrobia bacterium]|nr:nuclear transport factor 2 family protein [Elusimicrobiota bacterium]